MPLSIYRRHSADCKKVGTKAAPGPEYDYRNKRGYNTKCGCTIHVEGSLAGKMYRESLHTVNWTTAEETIKTWTLAGRKIDSTMAQPATGMPIGEALNLWYVNEAAPARELSPGTLEGYKAFQNVVGRYATDKGLIQLAAWDDVQVQLLIGSLQTKGMKRRTLRNRMWKLKHFFEFCKSQGYIAENPAAKLKLPKRKASEASEAVQPFSKPEIDAILAEAHGTDAQVYAFVMAGLHLGLRMGDIARLNKASFKDGMLLPFETQKSKTKVTMPVNPDLQAALANLPTDEDGYYFRNTPRGNRGDLGNVWGHRIKDVIRAAGVNGHPHQLRHTFAVRLLDDGFSLHEVSKLLGHKSVRITEDSYAKFTTTQQDALNAKLVSRHRKLEVVVNNQKKA